MTLQRVLLKLLALKALPRPVRRFLTRRPWTIEGGEAAGFKFGLPQNLDFIQGVSELPLQRSLAGHLKAGDVFYDVGANVGFFSVLAAGRVGLNGAVYSFEPVAENTAAIRRNAAFNNFHNLTVFEVAVDTISGTADLFLTAWDGGSSLSHTAVAPSEPTQRRRVSVVALDDIIETKGLRPPTVVKIDVEGAEMGVLRGMLKTIATFKPVIVYEVDDSDRAAFERRWKELDEFVAGLGYRVSRLESSYPNVTWQVGHSQAFPQS